MAAEPSLGISHGYEPEPRLHRRRASHPQANPDCSSGNANTDANSNHDTNPDTHANPVPDAKSHQIPNTDTYTDADCNTNSHTDTGTKGVQYNNHRVRLRSSDLQYRY